MKHRTWLLSGALACAAVAAAIGLAGVAGAAGRSVHPTGAARQAASGPKLSKCGHGQRLWAVVNADGTLARAGHGGKDVLSVAHIGTGVYVVTFAKDVSGAGYVATVGSPDPTFRTFGVPYVSPSLADVRQVVADLSNLSGSLTNLPFYLAVLC